MAARGPSPSPNSPDISQFRDLASRIRDLQFAASNHAAPRMPLPSPKHHDHPAPRPSTSEPSHTRHLTHYPVHVPGCFPSDQESQYISLKEPWAQYGR